MIALRVTRRPGATEPDATALAVPADGLTIGRSVDCGLVLADPLRLVSREHAQVTLAGEAARIRCASSSAALWVNDIQVASGQDRPLAVGDRVRIGGFELAVEPAAAAVQRSRLDRWFDLDGAPDPLSDESPLPALAAASEATAISEAAPAAAVVSWQTSRHVVRAGAVQALEAPAPPPPT
ncbi:MAG TPA: FHA domain-containing protein, partial [Ramlibacter sp.]|nr:FHA domain-containing protein [Ramlibacter sp.]